MTPRECVQLCEYIHAAVPHQQWAEGTPDVWWDLGLSQVSYDDAKEAVRGMVRGRVFIDFQGIVDAVRKLRAARLAGIDEHLYLIDERIPDPRAANAAKREAIARIANGEPHEAVFGKPAPVEQRRVDLTALRMKRPDDLRPVPGEDDP